MKNLGNLRPNKKSNRPTKRLGRGIGSGLGKTGGKGHKGQLARKGGVVPPGFEGGQMPLYRRLPKRGFTNLFRVEYSVVNVDLLSRFDAGTTVTPELLSKAGLIGKSSDKVKLLGRGKLEKSLVISVHAASQSALSAVKKAGGSIEFIKMM